MLSVFSELIHRSFQTIKKEPILLLPMMAVSIIYQIGAMLAFNVQNNLFLRVMFEWIIPTGVVFPICILFCIQLTRNRELMDAVNSIQQILFLGIGYLTVSIYQPIEIYFSYKFKYDLADKEWLASRIGSYFIAFILVTLLVRICLTYFEATYAMHGGKKGGIWTIIKASIQLFLQFKWVTIYMLIMYQVVSIVFVGLIVSPFIIMLPMAYQSLLISIVVSIQLTVYIVFKFKLYLLIKPLANLNYK